MDVVLRENSTKSHEGISPRNTPICTAHMPSPKASPPASPASSDTSSKLSCASTPERHCDASTPPTQTYTQDEMNRGPEYAVDEPRQAENKLGTRQLREGDTEKDTAQVSEVGSDKSSRNDDTETAEIGEEESAAQVSEVGSDKNSSDDDTESEENDKDIIPVHSIVMHTRTPASSFV